MYLYLLRIHYKKIRKGLIWWWLCDFFFSDFLYKGIYCGYSFELHRQVDAIQMRTHNICLYKKVNKKYTGCNLKTTEFHECALIGVCAVYGMFSWWLCPGSFLRAVDESGIRIDSFLISSQKCVLRYSSIFIRSDCLVHLNICSHGEIKKSVHDTPFYIELCFELKGLHCDVSQQSRGLMSAPYICL